MVNIPEWENTTLGNEVDFLTGFPFKSEQYLTDISQPKLLRGDNIVQGHLRWDNSKHWHKDKIAGLEQYLLQQNDVVLAMDRPWIEAGLKFSSITENDIPSLLVQRVSRLRGTETILSRFIKYIIGDKGFTDYILGIQTGTAVPHISSKQIKDYEFFLPPLPEQQAIVGLLGALDDKINLNQRMNDTLEGIAQALFKSWFVDFDPVKAKAEGRKPEGMDDAIASLFPSGFIESPVGLIPEGWNISEIGEVAYVVDCLHSKKPDRTNEGRPFLQLNNIRDDGLIDMTDTYLISDEDYKKWISRIEAQGGDCVITNVGRVGAVAQIPKGLKAALGRNMTAIRTKSLFKYPTFLICYLCSDLAKKEIKLKEDSGTILNALNVKNIPKLRFFKANKVIHDEFEKLVHPIRLKMEQNLAEITFLAETRDLLLPRLISGNLRVEEISEVVEALAS